MIKCEMGRTFHDAVTGCDEEWAELDEKEMLEWIHEEAELMRRFGLRAVLCRGCRATGYAPEGEAIHVVEGKACGGLVEYGGAMSHG